MIAVCGLHNNMFRPEYDFFRFISKVRKYGFWLQYVQKWLLSVCLCVYIPYCADIRWVSGFSDWLLVTCG